jgi:hypothetical protein
MASDVSDEIFIRRFIGKTAFVFGIFLGFWLGVIVQYRGWFL